MPDKVSETRDQLNTVEIICRPRCESDLAGLADLWVSSWRQTMPQIDFEARRAWFLDHLRNLETTGAKTICACGTQDTLLGFVSVNPQTQILDQLAGAPDAWGKGIAQRLLQEARLLSPRALVLDVNEENKRAIRFYEREAFVHVADGINAMSGLKTWRMKWQADGS